MGFNSAFKGLSWLFFTQSKVSLQKPVQGHLAVFFYHASGLLIRLQLMTKSSRSYFVPLNITDNTCKMACIRILLATACNTAIRTFVFLGTDRQICTPVQTKGKFLLLYYFMRICVIVRLLTL